jgi:formylglycine-generating enzyme required for sulfatase activity
VLGRVRHLASFGLFGAGVGLGACSLLVDTGGLGDATPGSDGGLPDAPTSSSGGSGGPGPGSEGGLPDGGALPPPSCANGGTGESDCGPFGTESCCASPAIAGGVFDRSVDNVLLFDTSYPAQISSFRLDRFEVTVGRFRQFVAAVVAGYTPQPGSGKHAHLNRGAGLSAAANDAGLAYEPGWDPGANGALARTTLEWTTRLSCHATFQTWTTSPAAKEKRPIVCVAWLEAQAFCIWDGGFLPSESEATYAAQAGDQQRVYPWSVPSTDSAIDCSYENGAGCASGNADTKEVGAESPKGDGRWQQADLTGNVREWMLDLYVEPWATPCIDCVVLTGGTEHATHGSGYFNDPSGAAGGMRSSAPARDYAIGFRCARAP